jgi:hypothetical protein
MRQPRNGKDYQELETAALSFGRSIRNCLNGSFKILPNLIVSDVIFDIGCAYTARSKVLAPIQK